MELRKQELLDLPADARVLIIKGEKDWMGPELALQPLRRQMKARTWQLTVKEMDHRFQCKDGDQELRICNAMGVVAGIWLRGDAQAQAQVGSAASAAVTYTPWDPAHGTEMSMSWDEGAKQVMWTGWRASNSKAADLPQVLDIAGLD